MIIYIVQKLKYMILKFILDNTLQNARTARSVLLSFTYAILRQT